MASHMLMCHLELSYIPRGYFVLGLLRGVSQPLRSPEIFSSECCVVLQTSLMLGMFPQELWVAYQILQQQCHVTPSSVVKC